MNHQVHQRVHHLPFGLQYTINGFHPLFTATSANHLAYHLPSPITNQQVHNMSLVRRTRASTPSTSNDSSRENNGTIIRKTKLSYHLDGERAIMKKLQACDRPNEMIEKATNNYVIDLSTAGFEAFREILLRNVHLSDTVRRSRHYEHEVKTEQGDHIVQDVLRINSWQALRSTLSKGRTGSLSVVVNMYRTTSRVLVNGRDSAAIASSINALLTDINSHPEVKAGNDYFKATGSSKIQIETKRQSTTEINFSSHTR